MASGAAEKKVEKSYLTSAVEAFNPWATPRSNTPTQNAKDQPQSPTPNPDDHSSTHLYGRSSKTYPPDCPPLKVQWFHAVDVPKRKPKFSPAKRTLALEPEKATTPPKKHSPFSASDSRSIESEYQKLLEDAEEKRGKAGLQRTLSRSKKPDAPGSAKENPYIISDDTTKTALVPVNEDFLFDVDIGARELAPAYWLGPIYDVRRGTWFYQDGTNLRPCDENLAAQLEDGYLKLKPWLNPVRSRSASGARTAPDQTPKNLTPKVSQENLKDSMAGSSDAAESSSNPANSLSNPAAPPQSAQIPTHRLFGMYMNNIVTYEDESTAWLSSDGVMSWVSSSVYERFAGGGYMSGVKLIRGYEEPSKEKDKGKDAKEALKDEQLPEGVPDDALSPDERRQKMLKRRSAPATIRASYEQNTEDSTKQHARESKLQRQLSSLMESDTKSKQQTEEEIRRRQEHEIQDDYTAQDGESQNREIEHLILVTHGIGQMLSLRMESVNFIHDVNVMRKTLKASYADSADLKALNAEYGDGPGNSRIQILPVSWRHRLDFPKRRERKKEHDLADVGDEEDEYPSLEDITIEGVTFARSLISDLALDVLLYQSAYRKEITTIVLQECNRIAKLFKERNPAFKGKIHLMGHSLGSAILFDILCQQRERSRQAAKSPLRVLPEQEQRGNAPKRDKHLSFDFEVEDFYALGSPVGLFQMLKGRTIAARHPTSTARSDNVLNADNLDDSFRSASMAGMEELSPVTGLPTSVSSPKCTQLFNIFYPSDPISYRMEPLVSPSMKSLKPQPLPYTKKGIFGNVAPQGLTGIGVMVGQSVSGLWSSFSAGIATNLLNRSLGFTGEDVAAMNANTEQQANANDSKRGEKTDARKKQLAADSATQEAGENQSGNDPTLIDDELETLFSKFQQTRAEPIKDGNPSAAKESEGKGRKLRSEESKVRALNRNGRVDYSIQESVLDFNPINTIASHMAYWGDEDVNHFILSQLLSNKARRKRVASTEGGRQDASSVRK